MADDDYADEYPEYDEYVDDITYGLGCEYNTDVSKDIQSTPQISEDWGCESF